MAPWPLHPQLWVNQCLRGGGVRVGEGLNMMWRLNLIRKEREEMGERREKRLRNRNDMDA